MGRGPGWGDFQKSPKVQAGDGRGSRSGRWPHSITSCPMGPTQEASAPKGQEGLRQPSPHIPSGSPHVWPPLSTWLVGNEGSAGPWPHGP